MFYSNFVPKTHHFWDIRLVSTQWPWNPDYGTLKVIRNDIDQSATYKFLLMFHSNYGPISYRFWDKWWLQSRITNSDADSHRNYIASLNNLTPVPVPESQIFPPVYFVRHWRGSPWNWVSALGVKKLELWGYWPIPGHERSLTISSAVWIQSTNVADGQTDTGRQQRPRLRITSHGKKVKFAILHQDIIGGCSSPLLGPEHVGGEPLISAICGQCVARTMVTFPATRHGCPLAGTKLYCTVTEAHVR